MKIALVEPPYSNTSRDLFTVPLGLLSLHAGIKGGHEISIIDLNFSEDCKKLKTGRFDLIGFKCLSCHRDFVIRTSKELKKEYGPTLVVGAHHATLAPKDLIKEQSIDYVIRGAGDISFPQLIRAINGKRSFSNIEGLCYRTNKKVHISDIAFVSDLEKLPMPSYATIDLEKYLKKNNGKICYESSRGCIHRCRYCSQWKICNSKFYAVSKEKVLSDLHKILNLSENITEIRFADNTFNYNKKRVSDICEVMFSLSKLIKRKINWTAVVRPENLDEGVVKKMKKSGLGSVFIGFESASRKSLKYLRRLHKIEEMLYAIGLFLKYNITARVSFQIGFPWETKEDMWKTVDMAASLARKGAVTILYKFTPFPGIDIDTSLLARKQASSYKFSFSPNSEFQLAFKHPFVKDIEIKKMISYHRNTNKRLALLSRFSEIKERLPAMRAENSF